MAIWIKMFRNNSWSLTQGGSQLQPQEIKMHQGCQCELWRLERMLGEYHDNLLFWCVTIWALLTIMTTKITLATFRSVESTRTLEKSNLLAVFPSMALVNDGCIVGKTGRRRRHICSIFQACCAIFLPVDTQVLLFLHFAGKIYKRDRGIDTLKA